MVIRIFKITAVSFSDSVRVHHIRFRPRLHSGPRWGNLQRSPRPSSWFKGLILLREGREGRGEKERKGTFRKQGDRSPLLSQIPGYAPELTYFYPEKNTAWKASAAVRCRSRTLPFGWRRALADASACHHFYATWKSNVHMTFTTILHITAKNYWEKNSSMRLGAGARQNWLIFETPCRIILIYIYFTENSTGAHSKTWWDCYTYERNTER